MTPNFIVLTRNSEDGPDLRLMVGHITSWMPDDDGPGSYICTVDDPVPCLVCETPRQIDELILRAVLA
jgi:hypothetical protein